MNLLWILIALTSNSYADGGPSLSITRQRTIALHCPKDDLAQCRITLTRADGEIDKSIAVPPPRAREILSQGLSQLTPWAKDSVPDRTRWSLRYQGKDLGGSTSAKSDVESRKLRLALLRVETLLYKELGRSQ